MEQIDEILGDLPELRREAADFEGARGDKKFLRIDNDLTKKMIKLDGVGVSSETPGSSEVRAKRKAAVKEVQQVISELEKNVQ